MSKRKLLLADDSVTIQKVVNLTFADEGIEVISVGDGDTAMAKVVEISPDLVMADVNMPGLNGYQICEQIKQKAGFNQTPVILLVGSFEPFDEDEARRVGADDFLTKPFQSIRQLVNKVTVLLNSSSLETTEEPVETPVSTSFDDTWELEKPAEDISFEETIRYDYTTDDEMIQTSQATAFALDNAQKFETRAETPTAEDFAKTQPLTNEDIKDFDLVEASEETSEESETAEEKFEETVEEVEAEASETTQTVDEVDETVDEEVESTATVEEPVETETTEESLETATPSEDEIPLPEVASVLESDEDDLLELPPIESDFEDDEPEVEAAAVSEETIVSMAETETTTSSAGQISPELIEAIAQRVIEKLSDQAVKEVAWEVVPQMTELIVKKMAEEKLKD